METLEQIPCLDFSSNGLYVDDKSRSWKELSNKVKDRVKSMGVFFVEFNKDQIPKDSILEEMVGLFNLPEETKTKHVNVGAGRYNRYLRSPFSKLHQSFDIDEANRFDVARDMSTKSFVINSMSSKMLDLSLIIFNMVFKSFGCEIERDNITSNFRLIKYDASPTKDPSVGQIPHTDKKFLTIICQNEVQGLDVMSTDGNWRQVKVPGTYFMVIVGDSLKAWSNGKLHAAKHRVMMREEKVRYSCGLFLTPKEDAKIKVPQKRVDEDHLLHYRSFTYSDFLDVFNLNFSEDALELFAGV